MKKIIWLDNDAAFLTPYKKALEQCGYILEIATTLTEGEKIINSYMPFDLFILDVMIPTFTDEEEKLYPPEKTMNALNSGLLFYQKHKDYFSSASAPVLVLTLRLDKQIADDFQNAGLPEYCLATKLALAEIPTFIEKIESLIYRKDDQKH